MNTIKYIYSILQYYTRFLFLTFYFSALFTFIYPIDLSSTHQTIEPLKLFKDYKILISRSDHSLLSQHQPRFDLHQILFRNT